MNRIIKNGMLGICIACAASSAMAAKTLDLTVKGKIIPPSCTPAFGSGGGVVDFGNIQTSKLNLTKDSALPDIKKVSVSVTCEEATRFAVKFNDQRADSRPTTSIDIPFTTTDFGGLPSRYFGLGLTAEKKQIGLYSIGVENETAKNATGESRYPVYSVDNGANWTEGMSNAQPTRYWSVKNDGSTLYGFAKNGESTVSPEKSMTFNLGVAAVIQDLTTLHVSDEISLDGLATISLVYL